MTFAQVNQYNDTEQIIDLSCLDTQDAQAITKQKIYDLGKAMRMSPQSFGQDQVLTVLYQNDHVVVIEDQLSTKAQDEEL